MDASIMDGQTLKAGAALVNPARNAAIIANVGVSVTVVAGMGAGAMAANVTLYGLCFFQSGIFIKATIKAIRRWLSSLIAMEQRKKQRR